MRIMKKKILVLSLLISLLISAFCFTSYYVCAEENNNDNANVTEKVYGVVGGKYAVTSKTVNFTGGSDTSVDIICADGKQNFI